ncbi:MAG: hypothetical protein HC848_01025 [Limnobacter sp.]|nr:hypothetical protein [Limnobacter sp.]
MSTFTHLWKNYPKQDELEAKCTNKQPDSNQKFANYCAVNMSECLHRSAIQIGGITGNKCWSHSGLKHVLLAQDLANGLKNATPPGFARMVKVNPARFQDDLKDKTGVIFFKDYWQRGNEIFENRSGDHIDLWNKNRITSNPMWIRNILEIIWPNVSDLNKSRELWFWEVK